MKMSEILKDKGRDVTTIDVESGIIEAAQKMADGKIGALLIEDDGRLGGIITERDIVIALAKTECEFKGLRIKDIMIKSENLIVAEPDDSEDQVMAVMIQKNIRHMPIVESGELAGMVSIRDVVRAHVQKLKAQVRFLTDFVE
jgi:CBS domain-containing protein